MSNKKLDEAARFLIDKYGLQEILDLHLELDSSPEDQFFTRLTKILMELAPLEFGYHYPNEEESSHD